MIHIEDEIFLKKKFDFEKLKEFGLCFENNTYIYSEDFMDGDFKAVIEISDVLKGKVIDNFSDEDICRYASNPMMESISVKFVKHTNPY